MRLSVLVLAVLMLLLHPLVVFAEPTATNQTVQVTLTLDDGSRLIGTTTLTNFPLRSEALGTMAIPLDKVRSLKFSPNHESVIVSLANGDKLQGSLGTVSLKLQTLLGVVTVPLEHVTAIDVQLKGGKLVEWDVLPFPRDCDWPGSRGEPATVTADEIVIRGQPVCSKQTYSAPLTFECELTVDQPLTHLENAVITLFPEGADPSLDPPVGSLDVLLQYEGAGGRGGHLYFRQRGCDVVSLTKKPFVLQAGKPYQLKVEVLSDSLHVTLNGQEYEAEGVTLPFKSFHIRLEGWKPDKVWHLRNIAIH